MDGLLGFLCGWTLFAAVDFLLYWPDPLPLISSIAASDPLVRATLGESLTFSPLWTGTVREGVTASVALPVRGEKGKGTVYGRALWREGKGWTFVFLQWGVEGLRQRNSIAIPAHLTGHRGTGDTAQSAPQEKKPSLPAPVAMGGGEGQQSEMGNTAGLTSPTQPTTTST